MTEAPAPFVISRSQATRLFPFGSSPATITVQFNKDFTGSIVEKVPGDFVISAVSDAGTPTPNPSLEEGGGVGEQTITWSDITAAAGETKTFSYTYDAPDVSPMYYKAGPLSLEPVNQVNQVNPVDETDSGTTGLIGLNGNNGINSTYTENRTW